MADQNDTAVPAAVRTCRKCSAEFSGHRCEDCHRASSAAYREKNREKVRAYQIVYCADEENKVRARERAAAWIAANPEQARTTKAAYSAKNSEKVVAGVAAWRKANPDAKRIQSHNYRDKKRASGKLSRGLALKLFKLQRGKCACCGEPLGANYHMDHIMPIALGGANVDANIQLLRQRCNNQKSAKHPVIFMQERGRLL